MLTQQLSVTPPYRQLRGYAFDPLTSLDPDHSRFNEIIYKVPWEDDLKPGPEGEYIHVIDRDPASNAVYKPVDLNDPRILASNGLAPSESNPQFHQQMVYAVIMTTIRNFERALGRKVLWSPVEKFIGRKRVFEYVPKLLVYPHALRLDNAYYSPDRKALLFGYYNAKPVKGSTLLPGGISFSCLSHDIIAHETTHALLDSVYNRFMETTNPDIAGFHEGFSDIVALLQHFTFPEIVRNQMRIVRGELDTENILAKLAVEFGKTSGNYHSLRDAIGGSDADGNWVRNRPSTNDYEQLIECHERGGLLVSAVFDAFITIYKSRTADLVRIATGGTGIVPPGEIHPDLAARLADEASKTASHVLNMCVRALDYCPPVDLTYGDYLRALITADKELVANDDHNYRVAFINAFRKRGIFPEGVPNLSVDTLCYNELEQETDKKSLTYGISLFLRGFKERLAYKTNREEIFLETQKFIRGDKKEGIKGLHEYLFTSSGVAQNPTVFENITGLVISSQYKKMGIATSRTYAGLPSIEIHSLRLNSRISPAGNVLNQIVICLSQRCKVSVKETARGKLIFSPFRYGNREDEENDSMIFRGGCTLIFDLDQLTLKHAISKPLFDPCHIRKRSSRKLTYNEQRLKMQYQSSLGDLVDEIGAAPSSSDMFEPLAALHSPKNQLL